MEVALIFIALFAAAFGISYMYINTRNKERMAMIDQGASADLFRVPREPRPRKNYSHVKFTLKFGMFLIGLGAGFIVGTFLYDLVAQGMRDLAIVGSVFICGGLGLVAGYFIGNSIDKGKGE